MRYRKACSDCQRDFTLNTDSPNFITFPVIVHCPYCNTANSFTQKRYPKIAPDSTEDLSDGFIITEQKVSNNTTETIEIIEADPEVIKETEQDKILPFFMLANKLGENTRNSILLANRLKNEIDNFTKYVTQFFDSQWTYATQFARSWRPGYVQEFLSFPFFHFPVNCEDSLAASYSRWVFCPKFFHAGLGYRIYPGGGFRLELVNQYSRLQFPVEPAIAIQLGIPPDLELEVRGDKIIGPSLRYCWKDIPGLTADADHHDNLPSVFIKDQMAARTWLTRHGVRAQESRPLKAEELFAANYEEDLKHSPSSMEAWKVFVNHGRVSVSWMNAVECRAFAYLMGVYMRGSIAIFTADAETMSAWKAVSISNHGGLSTANKFVYFLNGKEPVWQCLAQCRLIILDNYKELDPMILNKLFKYPGRIISVSSNPIFDANTANIDAAKLYALVPFQVQEFMPDSIWPEQKIKNLPDLEASLTRLTTSMIKTKHNLEA